MVDINSFATQITLEKSPHNPLINVNTPSDPLELGLSKSGGVDFLKALLGNIESTDGELKTADTANNNSDTSTSLKSEEADLALLQLALLGQDADKSLEEKLSELKIEELANTKENRLAQLTKLIDHLTSGLPEESIGSGTIEQLVNRLERRLGELEASLDSLRAGAFNSDDSAFKALIATGLNPAQLTNITDRIQEVEGKLGRKLTVEDLIAGVGNIIPVSDSEEEGEFEITDALSILIEQSQKNNEAQRLEAQEKRLKNEAAQSETIPTDDLNDGLNGGLNPLQQTAQNATTNPTAIGQANLPLGTTAASGEAPLNVVTEEIAQRLSNGDYKELFGAVKKVMMQAKANAENTTIAQSTAIQAHSVKSLLTFSFSDSLASISALSDAPGYDIQTGAPFNQSMQAASFASSNTIAGQTHAATRMVSAHISRAAHSGEAKQITLQLDPPELGRVEVRLLFGEESKVKANIVTEKPETLLMLQRDAQALERLLQDAGLDADGDSLDFQLADDGHHFNSDREGNSQNGGTGSGSDGSNDNEDLDIIQTTMDWDVDPETGHVHYNILA